MTFTAMLALPAADAVTHSDSSTRLIIAAVLGVAVIIVLIVWSRMHPFLALTPSARRCSPSPPASR